MRNLRILVLILGMTFFFSLAPGVSGKLSPLSHGPTSGKPYRGLIRLESLWDDVQQYLSGKSGDLANLESSLQKLSQERYNLGFFHIRLFAEALARASYEASEEGNFEKAALLSRYAREFDSTFPPAYYSQGKAELAKNIARLPMACYWYYKGIKSGFGYFWKTFFFLGNLFIAMTYSVTIALGLFILFLFIKYQELIRYELVGLFPSRFPPGVGVIVALFILIAPLLLTFRLLWVYLFWILLGWVYFSNKEKILVWILIVLMLVSPFILRYLNMIMTVYRNSFFRAGIFTSIGGYDPQAEKELYILMEKNTENPYYPFLLGLLNQKREQFYKAKDLYEKALQLDPTFAKAHNNLGSVYYALNDMKKARVSYNASISNDPMLAAPHFNLSKVHLNEYEFNKATEEQDEAKRLDPELVSYYVDLNINPKNNRDPDRILINVGLSQYEIFKFMKDYCFEKDTDYSVTWNADLWGLPASYIPVAALIVVVISLAAQNFRKNLAFSMFCKMCNNPTSQKDLKKAEGESNVQFKIVTVWPLVRTRKQDVSAQTDVFCPACRSLFSRREENLPELRMERMHEMEQNKKKNYFLHKIYSFLSPGLGYANAGSTWTGIILFWVWTLLLLVFLSENVFISVPYEIQLSDGIPYLSKIFIGIILVYYFAATYLASKTKPLR